MELEKFEQAKKVKENLDRLERQKRKLDNAFNSCGVGVTISFTDGPFIRKDEVSITTISIIKEMITKELERVTEEIELIKEEFEKI
jgi:hypothetical protein